ncbi:hypothetical protein BOTBODRAFT_172592 [Botryobasidium botryosum FD-172 SS1]|uniref:Uncharacterized protein n=1 Tax=Botryobasidium botryosum (strain FD-172 SS1) TaxID=930990 RepID=A0A067MMJ5_BOTB1|nr:hypothetical protein BOTBODRAFT_172592 [Botryobasidium botryosum FD-172 SS1]
MDNWDNMLSALAPKPIRLLFANPPFDIGEVAKSAVQTQLALYEENQKKVHTRPNAAATGSMFDTVAAKIADSIGDNPEEDAKLVLELPTTVTRKAIWKWDNLPYTVFRTVVASVADAEPERKRVKSESTSAEPNVDVDEWILRNETWLRDRRAGAGDWTRGLVKLSSHMDIVFPGSTLTESARTIKRQDVSGLTLLDQKRASSIQTQPSIDAFSNKFTELTGGLLKGLSWENVFVAGGIVAGSLFCVDDSNAIAKPEQWKHSDIDVYLYGLTPKEANEKIAHIFDVFKSNLEPNAPAMVVRNSKTITFFSNYPTKRIQIVLKLVRDPKEVLLNFDLDICSLGWDGKETWMLPRAVRALETGYNVFTMNLIHGHYLGDRRATQEQRVFKYANKGYGIRILPSYIEALSKIDPQKIVLDKPVDKLDIDAAATDARFWTNRAIKRYLNYGHSGRLSYFESSPHYTTISTSHLPVFTHAMLEGRTQNTADPSGRSCLSGFTLFVRHVALWEAEAAGEIVIQEDIWASVDYGNGLAFIAYDDTPQFTWDADFTVPGLINALDGFNLRERNALEHNLETAQIDTDDLSPRELQRISYAPSVEEIFDTEKDIVIPIWAPMPFVEFANDLVRAALQDKGLETNDILTPAVPGTDSDQSELGLKLVYWHISRITMWQQIDRRIDEVFEICWSFHRAFERLEAEEGCLDLFRRQLSQRTIRATPQDEYEAFAYWIGTKPHEFDGFYGPMGQGFSRDGTDEDEDEEEDEN